MHDLKTGTFDASQWQLVPKEPTEEMTDAARYEARNWSDGFPNHEAGYRAMLAAAPTPAAQSAGQEAVAWLINCQGAGRNIEYATIDENDTNHWPIDQWKKITKIPLYTAPVNASEPGAANFACYLIDHCEGETVTEEQVQRWLAAMLANPQYAAPVNGGERLTPHTADVEQALAADERAADAPQVGGERLTRDEVHAKALAMPDVDMADMIGPDIHEHHFQVESSSGIELCTYCGMSRVAAKVGGDERKAFESDLQDKYGIRLHRDENGFYLSVTAQERWIGWQARAALSADATLIFERQQDGFERCYEALGITDDRERSWSALVLAINSALSADGGDRKDAERYRHLRACNSGSLVIVKITGMGDDDQIVLTEQDADAEVDAERAAIAASTVKGDAS